MTLTELADLLDQLGDREIRAIENPHSYRGYYDEIAFEPSPDRMPAKNVASLVRRQIGETFTGYKGGEFTMTAHTPVWLAYYGSTGDAVLDIGLRDGEIITTRGYA